MIGKILAVCMFCHKNKVPIEDWNKRCEECRKKQAIKDKEEEARMIMTGKRLPAAVLEVGAEKQEVFVDKFGKEVDNPGYDLKNDPRGWKYTGKIKQNRTMIL